MTAVAVWIRELSPFWTVIFVGGSGVAIGIICTAVWWSVGKRLSSLPPASDSTTPSGSKPNVVPTKSGWNDLGYHGIFVKNIGDSEAFHVTMNPLQMGSYSIPFTGPEITYLEPEDTCFFHPNDPPSVLLKNIPSGSPIFRMIRNWQEEIGDWRAEAEGWIKFKAVDGEEYETRYTIGADVLNRNDGLDP